jgi:hypothetical protein
VKAKGEHYEVEKPLVTTEFDLDHISKEIIQTDK